MASTCTSMPTQVYVSTSARDAETAVARLTVCLVDIEMAEGQQTLAEPHQDSGYVVGFSPATSQSRNLRNAYRHMSTFQRQHVT